VNLKSLQLSLPQFAFVVIVWTATCRRLEVEDEMYEGREMLVMEERWKHQRDEDMRYESKWETVLCS
jgi:hypothetical protein